MVPVLGRRKQRISNVQGDPWLQTKHGGTCNPYVQEVKARESEIMLILNNIQFEASQLHETLYLGRLGAVKGEKNVFTCEI